ncbi:MAG: hypothetical protein R6X12_02875 [bacterium]
MADKDKDRLSRLEEQCRERGIQLVYDELQTEGGYCRLRDSHYIIINRRAATGTRARIIVDVLARLEVPSAPQLAPAATATAPGELPAELQAEGRP